MSMPVRRIGGRRSTLERLVVSAALRVTHDCLIEADVYERDLVAFVFSIDGEIAEVSFDAGALWSLRELSGRVLKQMDAWREEDETEQPVRLTSRRP